MYDICIIGAGIIGCAAARELTRYNVKVLVLEKTDDVSNGTTKANSGIVHGGYSAKYGTLKGELSIKGNRMYDKLAEELGFPLDRRGSLVLAFSEDEILKLEKLKENGEKNGVNGLTILDKKAIKEREPHVGDEAVAALYCPETAITSPYEFCIALAENAVTNGAEFRLNSEVTGITKNGDHFDIETTSGICSSSYIINAAGTGADSIAEMVGDTDIEIVPRRGEYVIMRRGTGKMVNHIIFQSPTKNGKGILVTSTVWGNLMIGPNSQEIPKKNDVNTNEENLKHIIKTARKSVPGFEIPKVIRSFAGIRPTEKNKDFIVRESQTKGVLHAAGIDSPGLTAAPAIAERITELLKESGLPLTPNNSFNPNRKPITLPHELVPFQEIKDKLQLPQGEPERVVCRCEQVREKTIADAFTRGLPLHSTDAIKRRTRAGMGACQGQFCGPRVKKLIAEQYNIPEEKVGKRSTPSGTLPDRVDMKTLSKFDV